MCFSKNDFPDGDHDPTIEDSYRKQIMLDEEEWFIEVIDTPSSEEVGSISDGFSKIISLKISRRL